MNTHQNIGRPALTPRTCYRLGLALAMATALFLVLAAGALGIIGAGGRVDRIYLVVLVVAVLGALLARLRAPGMVLVMLATAFAQVLVTATALVAGLHVAAGGSPLDIVGVNALYVALFCVSGRLFRRATQREDHAV